MQTIACYLLFVNIIVFSIIYQEQRRNKEQFSLATTFFCNFMKNTSYKYKTIFDYFYQTICGLIYKVQT